MQLKKDYLSLLIPAVIFGSVFIPRDPHLLGDTLLVISVLFLLMLYFLLTSRQGLPYAKATPVDLPILILIFCVIVSLVRSLNFYDSLVETLKVMAYVIMFFLVIYSRDRGKMAKTVIWALIITGLFVSLNGIYEQITMTKSFWYPRIMVYSTFPNPNHFGGYAAMTLTLALGLLLFDRLRKSGRVFLIIVAVFSALGVYASNSKGAFLSLIFSLFILAVLKGKKYLKAYGVLVFLVILGLLVLLSPIGKSIVPGGVMNDPYAYERFSLWGETVRYIVDYPLLGTGIGTFKDYYPQYKSMGEMRSAGFAHNELLNIWAETGLVTLFVCLWLLVLFLKQGVGLIKKTNLPAGSDISPPPAISGGMAGGILAACGCILVQSLVEFNLHTPGVAIALLSMVGVVISFSLPDKEEIRSLTMTRKIIVPVASIMGFVLCTGLLLMPLAGQHYSDKGDLFYQKQDYFKAIKNYELAITFNPLFIPFHMKLGNAFLAEGEILQDENFIYGARQEYKKCVDLYPRNVFYRLKLARFYVRYGTPEPAIEEYKQVLILAPNVGAFRQEYESLLERQENK
jgi:putative inorganic carbon (hco3(-)) transporter